MEEAVYLKGMGVLMAAYPDYPCNKKTLEAYREFLDRLSPQEFELAIRVHITRHKWFPKISELLQAALVFQPGALEVWNALLKDAENGGDPPALDPATEKALAAVGGWETLQYTQYDELKFKFAAFRDAYNQAVEKEITQRALPDGAAAPQGLLE